MDGRHEAFIEAMRRYIGARLDVIRDEELALSHLYGAISAIGEADSDTRSDDFEDALLSGEWMYDSEARTEADVFSLSAHTTDDELAAASAW